MSLDEKSKELRQPGIISKLGDPKYFEWLIDQVGAERISPLGALLFELGKIEYTWSIHNDVNRASDGLRLRALYFTDREFGPYPSNVSVLEVLLSFSKRIANDVLGDDSEDGARTKQWFYLLLGNLGLVEIRGDVPYVKRGLNKEMLEGIIFKWLNREFKEDGVGSPFPMPRAIGIEDQRTIELWKQFCIYLAKHPELEG